MQRARKRKATSTTEDAAVNSSPKRQKVDSDHDPEQTTQTAAPFVQQLRDFKDRQDRSITALFWTLPDKQHLRDYYDTIKLPISIDMVEQKLERREYPTITSVESDLRRMVSNAKLYNDEQSLVYADAERIRKMVAAWFKKNNPAYQDPSFACAPTPIPEPSQPPVNSTKHKISLATTAATAPPRPSSIAQSPAPPKQILNLSSQKNRKSSTSVSEKPALPEPLHVPSADPVKAFSQAQWQIIDALCKMDDYQPFLNKPDRELRDYYRAIKRPTSLNSVKKLTIGKHGHEKETGISDFKTWAAFEEEVAYVWNNARQYNEDGSDIHTLAGELEIDFKKPLALAKSAVDEPPQQPRLKLNARPKPVLHLGAKVTPTAPAVTTINPEVAAPISAAVPSYAGKEDARQSPGKPNGHGTPKPDRSRRSTTRTPVPASVPPNHQSPALVKVETARAPSPAPDNSTPSVRQSNENEQVTLTPVLLPRTTSQIPNSCPRSLSRQTSTVQVPQRSLLPPTFSETFSRSKIGGQPLMSNVHISTHPRLSVSEPVQVNVAPSSEFTHQSLAMILPPAHYFLQITPTVAPRLLESGQYKLFVTVNNVRVTALTRPPQLNSTGASGYNTVDRRPVYDAPLVHGVNRIEIEVAAVSDRGGALETEKVSCFANLM